MPSKPLSTLIQLGASVTMLFSVSACSEDPPAPACPTDFAAAASAPPVSFRSDVLPIFSLSCTASECHNVNDPKPKAELVLGVKGVYAVGANKWNWTFPPEANFTNDGGDLADGGIIDPIKDPHPLTDAVVNLVYADLMLASKTAPTVKRVVPSDPKASFLIDKLADIQNEQSYSATCQNQDPTKSKEGPCGDKMPAVGTGALCVASRERFDAVVQWVAQGAKNN